MTKLKPNDPSPDFTGKLTDGSSVRLKDYLGKKLIIYFYPMDDTPGCTAQACSLRDAKKGITKKGAAILGVSTQDSASHQKFTDKYKLNFPLLADTDRAVGKAYGTIGGGGLLSAAKAIVGMADRVTFIIDEKGQGRAHHRFARYEKSCRRGVVTVVIRAGTSNNPVVPAPRMGSPLKGRYPICCIALKQQNNRAPVFRWRAHSWR